MTSGFDTKELIAQTAGFAITDGVRRAAYGGNFAPNAKCLIAGAGTDLAWQMGGAKFVANAIGSEKVDPFGSSFTSQYQMARALYWAVFSWGIYKIQGEDRTLTASLIDGAIAPMVGDQIYGLMVPTIGAKTQ